MPNSFNTPAEVREYAGASRGFVRDDYPKEYVLA
jgi:hypothetical protein